MTIIAYIIHDDDWNSKPHQETEKKPRAPYAVHLIKIYVHVHGGARSL